MEEGKKVMGDILKSEEAKEMMDLSKSLLSEFTSSEMMTNAVNKVKSTWNEKGEELTEKGKELVEKGIETVQEEVEGMIEQALNGTNPSLVLCSCSCLQSLLSLPQDASSQERFIHSLELLFEKENEWLLLDEGASWKKLIHETVRGNCIHSLPR